MNDEISHRINTIESDIRQLRDMITAEQVAIEALRAVVSEHSKEIEKLGKVVEENTKNINKLLISTAKLSSRLDMLVEKLDGLPGLMDLIKDMGAHMNSNTKNAINAVVRVAEIAFIVFAGLKMTGLI